ncbi:MAG: transposase [Rhodobacteraceae bacterium]|nr:transposase [Paracoccaceae bacterium]
MKLPPKNVDTQFEDFLQDLPPDLEETAREFKAFARARKVKSVHDLLRLVFLYAGLDQPLREVAATFALLDEPISDEGVKRRLLACGPWMRALLAEMLPTLPGNPNPVSEAVGNAVKGAAEATGLRFLALDGSTIEGPGAKGTWYRLHLGIDLVTLEFTHMKVTDKNTGESLDNFALKIGDVVLLDRGYNQPRKVVNLVRTGVDVVLRLNPHNMPQWDRDGKRLDLFQELRADPQAVQLSFPVLVGSPKDDERVEGWVHAYRLPPEQAAEARRRCRANAKKGRTPKEATLFLAGWVLVFTSLAPEVLSAEAVGELYRVRWQVELAFKRLKSVLNLDALRASLGGALAEVYLHGKLLYALALDRRARRLAEPVQGSLDGLRKMTWWRVWHLVQAQVGPMITGAAFWKTENWPACLKVLAERPRRRKLQRLPEQALRVWRMAAQLEGRLPAAMPLAAPALG